VKDRMDHTANQCMNKGGSRYTSGARAIEAQQAPGNVPAEGPVAARIAEETVRSE
jgi:hypothetical protein